MEVIKFRGTKHPITVLASHEEYLALKADAAVKIINRETNLHSFNHCRVAYQFVNPTKAALDLELPVEITLEISDAQQDQDKSPVRMDEAGAFYSHCTERQPDDTAEYDGFDPV